jgi:hypothetical protein
MFGLLQAGILANQLLACRLAIHGYHKTKFTSRLWRHVTLPIQFTLVVDDFGVQLVVKEHAQHLIDALENVLHSFKRLGWRPLLWHQFEMGLWKQTCVPLYA